MDGGAVGAAFVLIREGAEWLRAGRELGFGALADPQGWLERIEGPGMTLEAGGFLAAAALVGKAGGAGGPGLRGRTRRAVVGGAGGGLRAFFEVGATCRRG